MQVLSGRKYEVVDNIPHKYNHQYFDKIPTGSISQYFQGRKCISHISLRPNTPQSLLSEGRHPGPEAVQHYHTGLSFASTPIMRNPVLSLHLPFVTALNTCPGPSPTLNSSLFTQKYKVKINPSIKFYSSLRATCSDKRVGAGLQKNAASNRGKERKGKKMSKSLPRDHNETVSKRYKIY